MQGRWQNDENQPRSQPHSGKSSRNSGETAAISMPLTSNLGQTCVRSPTGGWQTPQRPKQRPRQTRACGCPLVSYPAAGQRTKPDFTRVQARFGQEPTKILIENGIFVYRMSPYPPPKIMLTTNPLFSERAHDTPNSETGQPKLALPKLPSTHAYTTTILLKVRRGCNWQTRSWV